VYEVRVYLWLNLGSLVRNVDGRVGVGAARIRPNSSFAARVAHGGRECSLVDFSQRAFIVREPKLQRLKLPT